MKETGQWILGEVNNCNGCFFLDKETLRCGRSAENFPIKKISWCPTGRLISLPHNGQEMSELVEKVATVWRKEGENSIGMEVRISE